MVNKVTIGAVVFNISTSPAVGLFKNSCQNNTEISVVGCAVCVSPVGCCIYRLVAMFGKDARK